MLTYFSALETALVAYLRKLHNRNTILRNSAQYIYLLLVKKPDETKSTSTGHKEYLAQAVRCRYISLENTLLM